MEIKELIYAGMPRGIDKTAALILLVINVTAPGVGTIIAAFLGAECQAETIYVGIAQAFTTPLLGVGLIWAIAWAIFLYKNAGTPVSPDDEENPLVANVQPTPPAQ